MTAVVLGVLFVRRSLALQRASAGGKVNHKEAMRLFHFSIAYLSLLFVAMAADRLIGGGGTEVVYRIAFVAGALIFCAFQAAIAFEALRWRRAAQSAGSSPSPINPGGPPAGAGAGAPAGV
ncbi:MAG: hypothetical protein NVSMB32_01530 [Actinomycetota bacterium]